MSFLSAEKSQDHVPYIRDVNTWGLLPLLNLRAISFPTALPIYHTAFVTPRGKSGESRRDRVAGARDKALAGALSVLESSNCNDMGMAAVQAILNDEIPMPILFSGGTISKQFTPWPSLRPSLSDAPSRSTVISTRLLLFPQGLNCPFGAGQLTDQFHSVFERRCLKQDFQDYWGFSGLQAIG